MKAPRSASAARPGGAKPGGVRVAAVALALLLAAAPLAATVWTRSNLSVRIPKGTRVELDGATYAARGWNVSLEALEVRDGARTSAGAVTTSWVFHYTNTDKEPHFISLTIRCLDMQRKELARFSARATLLANRPEGSSLEVEAKLPEAVWRASQLTRIVVDFLSSPDG